MRIDTRTNRSNSDIQSGTRTMESELSAAGKCWVLGRVCCHRSPELDGGIIADRTITSFIQCQQSELQSVFIMKPTWALIAESVWSACILDGSDIWILEKQHRARHEHARIVNGNNRLCRTANDGAGCVCRIEDDDGLRDNHC